MRVNRDQRGAVAIIVAICAVMIFGFAAYAIDSGHLWAARRARESCYELAGKTKGPVPTPQPDLDPK